MRTKLNTLLLDSENSEIFTQKLRKPIDGRGKITEGKNSLFIFKLEGNVCDYVSM
jgi:hypothetical protein